MKPRLFLDIFLLILLLSGCIAPPVEPTLTPTDTSSPIPSPTKGATRTPQNTSTVTPLAQQPTEEWSEAVPIKDFNEDAPEAIVEALMKQWLNGYSSEATDPMARLANYRIEKIEIPEEWQDCASRYDADFIAHISYSVQPVNELPYHWWAEDGDFGEDNWMLNRTFEAAIRKKGIFYQMTLLGVLLC